MKIRSVALAVVSTQSRRQAPDLCRTTPRRQIPSPVVTPASGLKQRGHVMSKFEFRFGVAAILLAILLAALGSFTANGSGAAAGVFGGAADRSSQSDVGASRQSG